MTVFTKYLGAWQIAGNTCEATISVDRPRAITISFAWTRDPGPTENEHLELVLPDIVGSALDVIEHCAAMGEAIQDLIAEGKLCRIGIRDGLFVHARTDADRPDDRFTGGNVPQNA
jgi:hypothetical protein